MTTVRGVVLAVCCLLVGVAAVDPVVSAPTGSARTPPMGWNSWNAYGCDIDQQKIRAAADAIVAAGLRDVGYEYVNVDDCWQATTRDVWGNLRADPARFPDGMKALADYVHGKGLRFGIYATPGTRTCANLAGLYPGALGSLGHERQDAAVFAAWGVDYLKYDWCRAEVDGVEPRAGFTLMRDALDDTGRAVVYSIHRQPQLPVDSWRPSVANSWRTTGDIAPTWDSVTGIVDRQVGLEVWARPGAWNDPDMLEVGNGALTPDESRAHFSLWAVLSAPLLAGNRLDAMSEDTRRVLTNRDVVAVDQDWAGSQGYRVRDGGDVQVWVKPLSGGDRAVAVLNRGASTATTSVTAAEFGFPGGGGLTLRDLWSGVVSGAEGPVAVTVRPHAAVLYRVSARR
ncbi:glycoside hydrolase family 27 protein [Actinosynnema sp. NPDC020468]|uniref:glycoside hydrolase family 27 protein n=1 Tax=Actinosynnema sp. NPDC020468 TaxID=3154488 RepID=UPI0033C74187